MLISPQSSLTRSTVPRKDRLSQISLVGSCTVLVNPIKDVGEYIIKVCENEFEDTLHQYDNPIPKFITDVEALEAGTESGYSPNFHPDGGDTKGPEEINANEEHNNQDAEDEPVIEP